MGMGERWAEMETLSLSRESMRDCNAVLGLCIRGGIVGEYGLSLNDSCCET